MIWKYFQLPVSLITLHCTCAVALLSGLLVTFPSPVIAPSVNKRVPFSLSQIMTSSLLLGMILSPVGYRMWSPHFQQFLLLILVQVCPFRV